MSTPMTEMAPIRFGDLEVARVEEMIRTVSPRYLYAGIANECFEPYLGWLLPHFSTEDFKWRLSIHALRGTDHPPHHRGRYLRRQRPQPQPPDPEPDAHRLS